jgi:hypothetical protein
MAKQDQSSGEMQKRKGSALPEFMRQVVADEP